MIKIYTAPSCISCRKVKKYFKEHNIPYIEKNILATPLTRDDIMRMLMVSEGGFDDIISVRSNVFKEKQIDFEKLNSSEMIDFIIAHPTVLKRPIIVTDMDLQVGYNADDITLFLPEDLRACACNQGEENCDYISNLKIK